MSGRKTDPEFARNVMLEMGVRPLSRWPGNQKVPWPSECLHCGERDNCKPHFTSVRARWLSWQAGERKMLACNACAQRATAEHQRQLGYRTTVLSLTPFSWQMLTPITEYINQKTSVRVRCTKCLAPREGTPDNLKHTKCECSKVARQPLINYRVDLWRELHPSRNEGVNLGRLGTGTRSKVWWRCPKGEDFEHDFKLSPAARVAPLHNGCPFCNGKRAIPGLTDFLTWADDAMPEKNFRQEFHQEQPLLPSLDDGEPSHARLDSMLPGSQVRVNWQCLKPGCGFTFEASPFERGVGQDCPACAGKRVNPGVNDLASQSKRVASEWNYSRNGLESPAGFLNHSNRKVWWVCRRGHEWESVINSRTGPMKSGCPSCAESGYRPSRPGILYFIQNEELGARKFGITNSDAKKLRLKRFEKMGWTQITILEHPDGQVAKTAEKAIRNWLRVELKIPKFLAKSDLPLTEGWTETFALHEGPSNYEVVQKYRQVWAASLRTRDELARKAG